MVGEATERVATAIMCLNLSCCISDEKQVAKTMTNATPYMGTVI